MAARSEVRSTHLVPATTDEATTPDTSGDPAPQRGAWCRNVPERRICSPSDWFSVGEREYRSENPERLDQKRGEMGSLF